MKLKERIALIFATIIVALGFGGLSILAANAETEFIPTSYKYVNEENENQIVMIDLQTDDFAVCRMIEKIGDGSSEFARINANYTIQDNILTVTAVNGEHLGDFYIGADNQLTAIYYDDEPAIEDNITLDEIADIIAEYIASKTDVNGKFDFWGALKDGKTYLSAGLGVLVMIALTAVYSAVKGHFCNKKTALTKVEIKEIAKEAVKGVVGQSINLDISAEVNKTVARFFEGIKAELDDTFDVSKNTAILSAEIANALSKSKVLTPEEQKQLHADAVSVLEHAQKGGKTLSAPVKVLLKEEKQETKEVSENVEKTVKQSGNPYMLDFTEV